MIKYALIILFAMGSTGWGALTTAPRKGPEGNRFLFVVDTSRSMKRIEHAGRQTVHDLVYSGIEGRMQPGDTFGVWTFTDEVKGGVFPVQTWAPEKGADLAGQVGRFLKEQLGGRTSRLEGAITNVERLVKSVRDVDVVILTSASARFRPDETWGVLELNWKSRLEEARKGKKAILITLAGRGGRIAQATVALQGERLNLAAPPERRPAPMAKTNPTPEPPKPTREPIIMRGKPKARPVEEIPTQFSPPPTTPAPVEPAPVEPLPEPVPVPVLAPVNPIVSAPSPAAEPPKPDVPPEITVAARQPGRSLPAAPAATQPPPAVSARMLIIAGASLVLIAVVMGTWMLAQARARARVSYISRSLANKP